MARRSPIVVVRHPDPGPPWPGSGGRRAAGPRRGVVLAMVILCLVLLVGLVLFVMNVGWNTTARSTTQNAADSAAAAGAGFMARSFNTVAMDNVGTSQLIAAVQVLDSVPLAVEMTLKEENWMSTALHAQLDRGVDGSWVRDALTNYLAQVDTMAYDESAGLKPIDDLFNHSGFDVTKLTFYNGPEGRGKFWQAMEAMDQVSLGAMNHLGELAVENAYRAAAANHPSAAGGDTAAGLLLPEPPAIPWKHGHFDDYERPVKAGLLPGHDTRLFNIDPVPNGLGVVDDKITNRGPYDAIFGWRERIGMQAQGYWEAGTGSVAYGSHGHTPLSGSGFSAPGRFVQTGVTPPTNYTTYGTLEWALRRAYRQTNDRGPLLDRYADRLRTLANIKLSYLWPTAPYATGLTMVGYRNAADKAAGKPAWTIPINKDYHFFFDGPQLLQTTPMSFDFYLEDGVDQSSNDVAFNVRDLRNGYTQVTYIFAQGTQDGRGTRFWVYDITDKDGNIVMEGLGRGDHGGDFGMSVLVPTPLKQILEPDWVIDFPTAKAMGDNETTLLDIKETQFLAVEIVSKYPKSDSRFLTEGTWRYVYPPGARLIYRPGWEDPTTWSVSQINDYIWRDEWSYSVYYDTGIEVYQSITFTINGTSYTVDENHPSVTFTYDGQTYTATFHTTSGATVDTGGGHQDLAGWLTANNIHYEMQAQTVYRVDDFMFVGINRGPLIDVRNPNNVDSIDSLPGPIDFDHSLVDSYDASREKYFTLLGVAWRQGRARWWSARFDNAVTDQPAVSTAQVRIFNDHSWDLWTQMWGTRLEPVHDLAGWSDQLTHAADTPPAGLTLTSDQIKAAALSLRHAQELEAVMQSH